MAALKVSPWLYLKNETFPRAGKKYWQILCHRFSGGSQKPGLWKRMYHALKNVWNRPNLPKSLCLPNKTFLKRPWWPNRVPQHDIGVLYGCPSMCTVLWHHTQRSRIFSEFFTDFTVENFPKCFISKSIIFRVFIPLKFDNNSLVWCRRFLMGCKCTSTQSLQEESGQIVKKFSWSCLGFTK